MSAYNLHIAMSYKLLLVPLLSLLCTVNAQVEKPVRVCIRHMTVPARYPVVARAARLQGTVVAKLKISADGTVAEATVDSEDPLLIAHPLLQFETRELVRKWTFECESCAPGLAFEHVIRFNYRLEGEDSDYDNTTIALELPNEVTIADSPTLCDHCPRPKKKNQ
jgi:TonB family protein